MKIIFMPDVKEVEKRRLKSIHEKLIDLCQTDGGTVNLATSDVSIFVEDVPPRLDFDEKVQQLYPTATLIRYGTTLEIQ